MAKAKKGDLLSCQVCGLIVAVDEACNCGVGEIVCCDEPMSKGKVAAAKARKIGVAAAKDPTRAKTTAKVKKAAKPKAARKVAKPKARAKAKAAPKKAGAKAVAKPGRKVAKKK